MRRQDEIRPVHDFHERMRVGDRLRGDHVECRAPDLAALQGIDEGALVDKAAARGVDHQRAFRHLRELVGAEQIAGAVEQRAVQGDDIAFRQNTLERGVQRPHAVDPLIGREADFHAEGFGQAGNRLAEHAVADDADHLAPEIEDRIVEVTELVRFLPAPGGDRQVIWTDRAA